MDRACACIGEKPEGKRPLGRPIGGWGIILKWMLNRLGVRGLGWCDSEWGQTRDYCERADLPGSVKCVEFLTSWGTVSFLWRILLLWSYIFGVREQALWRNCQGRTLEVGANFHIWELDVLGNLILKYDFYFIVVIGIQITALNVIVPKGLLTGRNLNNKCFRHEVFEEIC